jgi:Prp8 binding protein
MLLAGHKAEVFTVRFSPDGKSLASGSFDKMIYLWNTYGDCANFGVLKGHSGAITELHWSPDGIHIYSSSTDKSVGVFDAQVGERVKRFKGHQSFVQSCHTVRRGPPLIVSGSDDSTAKLWDTREKRCVQTIQHKFPVTAVSFNDSGDHIFTGGLDNVIRMWDLRKAGVTTLTLSGHEDTVSGLALSPDGNYILSNAMDNTVRIWDVRPFALGDRNVKTFHGALHNFEKNLLRCNWSPDGNRITAGSSDRFVYVWDTTSRRILYKLPGHAGSVNEVIFHPKEPIIASCSSDRNIYLGELLEP